MQTGTVQRHGKGWRGLYREAGKNRSTRTVRTKGEARAALNAELDRLALGDRYRAPITLEELAARFLSQYVAAPQTVNYARRRLVRPLAAFGDAQAGDVTPESLQRFLAGIPGKAWRHDILRTLRMVYGFGVANHLLDVNPARQVRVPAPIRGERILPFETWEEVETVADECGRWGPLVIFMADTGARPAEAVAVEHRHVHGARVELPGHKTELAWRTVHMTSRGQAAVESVPRSIATRCVFNIDGRPISWVYFWREVWRPALAAAGLAYRAPYNLRHTFAFHSLRAGVPIATLARDMGHTDVSRTFTVYGGWCQEMGADAAALREAFRSPAATTPLPGTP
jgi:site-specific recombinase XerD